MNDDQGGRGLEMAKKVWHNIWMIPIIYNDMVKDRLEILQFNQIIFKSEYFLLNAPACKPWEMHPITHSATYSPLCLSGDVKEDVEQYRLQQTQP